MHFAEDQEALGVVAGQMEAMPTECTCPRKSSKQNRCGPMKRIPDFNLLNIPSSIDMYEVMAHYIMPRLPDGYRIKTDAINLQHQQRRSSLMKYAMPELKRRSQKRDSNVVTELLEPTSSPRQLFPVMSYKRAFQVEIQEAARFDNAVVRLGELEDKGMENSDQKAVPQDRKDVYMLSRFLKDLDKLKLAQCPKFQKTLNDSLILNSPKKERGSSAAEGQGEIVGAGDAQVWANALKIIEGDEMKREESRGSFVEDEKCRFCQEKEEAGKSYSNMGHWSSRDVHDVKFNEDKFTIQFRTGRLGYFGFAANRYSNLPFQVDLEFRTFSLFAIIQALNLFYFQTWELKPDTKNLNLITFTLTAAVVSVDISISAEGVRLNTIQGCSPSPFQGLLNQFMEFKALKEVLLKSAVDVFPEEGSDATIYTEGSCEKHNVMEGHLYECMASVAMSHNFSWSRWNLLAGESIFRGVM